jgi:2-polyprenyl-3-methyl-5-hydroxy-6-metoxy-1,4-benzoquinol methylase
MRGRRQPGIREGSPSSERGPGGRQVGAQQYPALLHYRRHRAEQYDQRRFTSRAGRATDLLEWLLLSRALKRLRRATQSPIHTALDVPIGTGRMAERMTRTGFLVTGADASEDMLDIARAKESASRYVVARIESLPFREQEFDVVVSVRLFGHLPDAAKADALHEIRRVSRRGAVVFFAGTTRWLDMRRAWQLRVGRPLTSWYPVTEAQMRELAGVAGLTLHSALRLHFGLAETRAAVLVLNRPFGDR